jgi:hypothetical protein
LKNKYKKVEIEWMDSKRGDIGWEYIDNLSPVYPAKCITLGFLLEDTKEYKTIVQTISESQVLNRVTIPNCCVKRIKTIG